MSFFSRLFGGSDPKTEQLPTRSPEQLAFLSQLMQMLGGQGLQGGGQALSYLMQLLQGGPEATKAFTDPMMREFNEQIVPNIAERFTGSGAQRSSAFGQQLGAAGAGLEENLAKLRAGLQGNAASTLLQSLQGLGGLGLGVTPFGYMQSQGSPGLLGYGAQALGYGMGALPIGWGAKKLGILS